MRRFGARGPAVDVPPGGGHRGGPLWEALGRPPWAASLPSSRSLSWRTAVEHLHVGRAACPRLRSWRALWARVRNDPVPPRGTWGGLCDGADLGRLTCPCPGEQPFGFSSWNVRWLVDPHANASCSKRAVILRACLKGEVCVPCRRPTGTSRPRGSGRRRSRGAPLFLHPQWTARMAGGRLGLPSSCPPGTSPQRFAASLPGRCLLCGRARLPGTGTARPRCTPGRMLAARRLTPWSASRWARASLRTSPGTSTSSSGPRGRMAKPATLTGSAAGAPRRALPASPSGRRPASSSRRGRTLGRPKLTTSSCPAGPPAAPWRSPPGTTTSRTTRSSRSGPVSGWAAACGPARLPL